MLIDERRQQVARAVHAIPGLTREDRRAIIALDLPIYDSLVVAYLKLARYLLNKDSRFNWEAREKTWHMWRDQMLDALEGSLRYRENDSLIVAVAVCVTLFPAVHQGAGLMAYKILDDVVTQAQRSGYNAKRERVQLRPRVKDLIQRVSVWIRATDLVSDAHLSPPERADLAASGATQAWGVSLNYQDAVYVMHVVNAVVPIRWLRGDTLTLLTPVPEAG